MGDHATTAGVHDAREIKLHVRDNQGIQDSPRSFQDAAAAANQPPQSPHKRNWQWWLFVALNIFLVITGLTVGVLLGRFYYEQGGNSKWMSTLVQSAGFPILLLPFFLFPSPCNPSTTLLTHPSSVKIAFVYIALGVTIAGDNLMFSYGLLYLPVSTYSLISASQLAFNAVFSYFINSQRFTALIFNSVVILTFSAALLGVQPNSGSSSNGKYAIGFVLTVCASGLFSLILSLMQLNFEKLIKKETYSVVMEAQISTAFIASCASIVGLFASGEWSSIHGEYESFEKGKASYAMTLVGICIGWQLAYIGAFGLVFLVSSLFSNVISTVALPIVPIFGVIFLHDKMNGVKIMAMLMAIWGFMSYIYQYYLDEAKAKKVLKGVGAKEKEISLVPTY